VLAVCCLVAHLGEPCAGKPQARFDGEGQEIPALYPTEKSSFYDLS
jgi:hypothetical protein